MPMERLGMLSGSGQRGDSVRKGETTPIEARNVSDRRVSKTRALLLASFDRLLLARGYDDVSVRQLTADADVGRSTFYEHFEGKEDLLAYSVAGPISVVAAASTTSATSEALRHVFTHLDAQRALASALLEGSARSILIRVLASKLEQSLEAIARRSAAPPIAPLPFLAVSLAHAQLGAVDAWLSGDGCCDARTAALVLHATTRAGVAAMFGGKLLAAKP